MEAGLSDANSGPPVASVLAEGQGWLVTDVVCRSGPRDRPYEERHSRPTVAIVLGGSFQYRSRNGRELMSPGSLLLGSTGQQFECGHEHGAGDHCISFSYSAEYFDRLAFDLGAGVESGFKRLRLPPFRMLAPIVARATTELMESTGADWEEIGLQIAQQALQLDRGLPATHFAAELSAESRVTRVVRMIERDPDGPHRLEALAREARLSPYHFLRTFEQLTGVTPHQYVLRARLQRAAIQIRTEPAKIVDIALQCGFGDISNFTRTFRAEFGASPRKYRMQSGRHSVARIENTSR